MERWVCQVCGKGPCFEWAYIRPYICSQGNATTKPDFKKSEEDE